MNIIDELSWRGAVNQMTDEEGLRKLTEEKSISLYCGVDPTGDSMHIGHLIPFMMLKRFANAGHHPYVVIGGGTGAIGDPSGRKTERQLQTLDKIKANAEKLKAQFMHLFGDSENITFVNNYDWLSQISLLDFLRDFKGPHTLAIVDPVMGDNGQLYPSYTQEMCDEMRRLLAYADVVTPNVTEACELLNLPYRSDRDLSEDDFAAMAKALADKGPQGVILTGIHNGPYIGNFIYDQGKMSWVRAKKVGGDRSGTGDVFTAIVSASVVRGESLEQAVQKASDFICRVMAYTEELDLPHNAGLAFEEYLTTLR